MADPPVPDGALNRLAVHRAMPSTPRVARVVLYVSMEEHHMETILIVVVLILLLGGGGFYWRGRRT